MTRDVASEARLAQVNGGYRVDVWVAITLQPMTKVWQGIGGESNFFLSEEDAREAKGAYVGTQAYRFAETLWRLAQVQPNAKLGFRSGIQEFVVDIDTKVAMGVCLSNPVLGSGSVVQYYIPDWASRMHKTGRKFTFDEKAMPNLISG
jgi:hypothetical protein